MDASKDALRASVPLESVLCTEELKRRPSRRPDYQAENQALLALAQELTNSPGSILQRLVDIALELCRAHSAGISLLEEDGPPGGLSPEGDHFRWHAVAGQWAPLVWNTTTPCDYGPCGTVLDRDSTLLFSNAHRYYMQFAGGLPLLVEGLLVPFHVGGRAVGTVWVMAHDETRKFDAEDQRLLESLSTFAATAYQARLSATAHVQANQDLQAEITERRRADEALQEADHRKSEFLAMLAHELRNPLAPVRNALRIMRRTASDPTAVNPSLDMLERQVGHMVRLVDDLLDVSRISRGMIELRPEDIELASTVHHAVEAARPFSESMQHELTVSLPWEPMYLHGDRIRLAQVFGNLLNNACKYTEKGGRILLSAEQDGQQAVIRVRDSGIGIASDQLGRIFDMFTQVDTSLERSQSGLGIGLMLVKKLVEMHGGTVEAHSDGVGQGSEFVVALPLLLHAPIPRPSQPPPSEPPATTGRRILIVDDNADAAESLALLLDIEGNETQTASDGVEAVEVAATFRPDVVLLDIGLPKLNGYEAARKIRDEPWGRGMVLVALTGWGQEGDREKSKAAGFDGHMVKPLDHAALIELLAELLPTSV